MASKVLIVQRAAVALSVAILCLTGCKKKDRLSVSTSSLSVSPAATQLLKGEQVTLTARRVAPNGTVQNLPADWEISGSCVSDGDLSTSFGTQVIFTAPSATNNLCDVVISATYANETADSKIAIVTYKPAVANYNVYSDQGIPTGSTLGVGPIGTEVTITEPSTGYAPEGNKYLHLVQHVANALIYIQLPTSADLSAYSAGKLKFSIYLGSAGGTWDVKVKDTADHSVTLGGANGFSNGVVGSWQEVSINISDFVGLDKSAVTIPFLITNSGTPTPVYDIDAVRWEP